MDDDRVIEAAGVRLAYRVWGSPGAPPLVLLHGLGEGAADWDGVAPAFARHWRVYAPDLRGHGSSDRPGDYSVELMAADALGFLDALQLDRVDLIGHSMGGLVGFLLAGDHPDRVGRLILEDVAALRPRERGAPERPEGELPFDWEMVLAIGGRSTGPIRPGWTGSAGSRRRPWSSAAARAATFPRTGWRTWRGRSPAPGWRRSRPADTIHDTEPDAFTRTALAFLGRASPTGGTRPL